MDPNQITADAKTRFTNAVTHLQEELKSLRTGRAHASMLDGVMVEAYGTPTPLNQVGNVSAPESQLLQITPFDPNNIEAINVAIRDNQSLGFNPSDDGRVIRIQIPALTEERRRDMVKMLGGKVEDSMVVLRQVRHEARERVDAAKKSKDISEDDAKTLEKEVDEDMNRAKAQIDGIAKTKEQEMLTV
jgi:ribosome recycling factor